MSKLTEGQYKVLKCFDPYGEYSYYYRYFESKTGLDRETLKKIMKELRQMELVEHNKGLFDEDGMTAGSGFGLKYPAINAEKLIAEYEKEGD